MKKVLFINLVTILLIFIFFTSTFDFVLAEPARVEQEKKAEIKVTTVTLDNPLGKDNDDPRVIAGNIIKAMLGIVGSLALLMFIYGGFLWVISAGNEEKVMKGKQMIMWASFGLAVIFFAYAMVRFVISALTK